MSYPMAYQCSSRIKTNVIKILISRPTKSGRLYLNSSAAQLKSLRYNCQKIYKISSLCLCLPSTIHFTTCGLLLGHSSHTTFRGPMALCSTTMLSKCDLNPVVVTGTVHPQTRSEAPIARPQVTTTSKL